MWTGRVGRYGVGWLLLGACVLASTGCGKSNERRETDSDSDFERGTIADVRLRACKDYNLQSLSAEDSLSLLLTQAPEAFESGVACVLSAQDCAEVAVCEEEAFGRPSIDDLPLCDEAQGSHCDGDILKRCTTDDDVTFHELSYDCVLADATCAEGVGGGQNGDIPWVECVPRVDLCEGVAESYCDGTRAVVCRANVISGLINPAVYDCADVFGSTCVELGSGRIDCEGPAVGEAQCDDGIDQDEDGAADCADSDCDGAEACFEDATM